MATSMNGWYASPDLKIRPLIVAGESFSPGVLDDDDVFEVLKYLAEQLHERVEPIVRGDWHQADDWGFYYKPNTNDPTKLSNHASGTAFDYNATRHPNGVITLRTWTPYQINQIRRILQELDDVVGWGGEYQITPDAMHFEIIKDKKAVAAVAAKLREGSDYMASDDAKRRLISIEEKIDSIVDDLNSLGDNRIEKPPNVKGGPKSRSLSVFLGDMRQDVKAIREHLGLGRSDS